MARIRTIKPEFWDSPDTAKASLRARLLYISMWNLADDYGVGDGNFKRIIGFAFPNDEIGVAEIPRLIAEVSRTFSVMFFDYEGRPYYWIPSWETHQRTEKRAKQRVPFPENPKTLESSGETAGDGKFAASVGDSGAGTGEQGNRGTGEQGIKTSSKPPASTPTPNLFDQFWEWYPRKVGKEAARKAWDNARRRTDQQNLLDGVERFRTDPNLPVKEFIPHPATWLNEGRWDDEPLPVRGQQQQAPRMDHSDRARAKEADMLARFQASQEPFLEIEA